MIIDLNRFVTLERSFWTELEGILNRVETDNRTTLSLEEARRFHYLYDRTAAGLARIQTFSAEPGIRRYLENLVARAYSEMHETRTSPHRFAPLEWFFQTWPQTFRRHLRAFGLSVAITVVGALFGGLAVAFDPEAKEAIMPERFAQHLGDPTERVMLEESDRQGKSADMMAGFSAQLMVNNIGVSVKALALGMTWGIGTVVCLFYNGVILGVVAVDYILAGQLKFLLAWLLPHGVIEIPAALMGGQGGLILAGALVGWGERTSLTQRLRAIRRDLVTLILGVTVMLVWAGLVEAFLSQFHEPMVPYWVKISFGVFEFVLLVFFLSRCGRTSTPRAASTLLPIPNSPSDVA